LQDLLRDAGDDLVNCCKQFFRQCKDRSLQQVFEASEEKEVRGCEIR
jgi:hypothetical protein